MQIVEEAISVINQEQKDAVGLFVWLHIYDPGKKSRLKAKIVDVQIRLIGGEFAVVYVTKGDFRTYVPSSPGFRCGSYQKVGSGKRHTIAWWSEIASKEDHKKHLAEDNKAFLEEKHRKKRSG